MGEKKKTVSKEPLYIQLYEYYKKLILQGSLKVGDQLPAIRRCALDRQISKTTVEAGYMQLCAEGYIHGVSGSGYYVNEIEPTKLSLAIQAYEYESTYRESLRYDFISSRVDDKSFDFEIWRRYMKSALRNTQRLLAYGDPQGEMDLREALRHYVKATRGVVCATQQIIIGAGVQSLIHILCGLIEDRQRICFTGNGFAQGEAVFQDRGFVCLHQSKIEGSATFFEKEKVDVVYISPSHMTPWGEVMPIKTRRKLLEFAEQKDCLMIEDDFGSEFRYYRKLVPSLQSLEGGSRVVYIGSFSRLLLPSLRIAFMVLPITLLPYYQKRAHLYNQTASTAEQIALCQFIRDGHLKKQIKKARKLYLNKSQQLGATIDEVFKGSAKAILGSAGFLVRMEVRSKKSGEQLIEEARQVGVGLKLAEEDKENKNPRLVLSCASVEEEKFKVAMETLRDQWLRLGSIVI